MILKDIIDLFFEDEYKIGNRLGEYIICRSKDVIKKYFGWMKLAKEESIFFEDGIMTFVIDDFRIDWMLKNLGELLDNTKNI